MLVLVVDVSVEDGGVVDEVDDVAEEDEELELGAQEPVTST